MTIVDDLLADLQANAESRRKFVKDILRPALAFVEGEEKTQADTIRQAGLDAANTWWNSTIQPTLLWNNTQSLEEQRANILTDYNNIKLLLNTETDQYRLYVINQKLQQAETKFKQIKASL